MDDSTTWGLDCVSSDNSPSFCCSFSSISLVSGNLTLSGDHQDDASSNTTFLDTMHRLVVGSQHFHPFTVISREDALYCLLIKEPAEVIRYKHITHAAENSEVAHCGFRVPQFLKGRDKSQACLRKPVYHISCCLHTLCPKSPWHIFGM